MRTTLIAMLLVAGAALPGRAEIEVSVTLSGSIDEIMTVLNQLQALGVGGAPGPRDGLTVEVQSIAAGAVAPSEEAPDSAPPPRLALGSPVVPAQAEPGAEAQLNIQVVDDDHVVDTVTARIMDTAIAVDLFDSGTHGDQTAGDGIWSGLLVLPEDLAPGEYRVVFSAYDATGNAVPQLTPGGELVPLTAAANLRVAAP